MKKYNLVNNLLGWVCFAVAAVTYLLTIEPTASFWDCPEFISQGAKLEVGHPPGNPIFMLAARFFVTLFGGGMSTAAIAVNTMSALLSAATILLLFWTVTHLTRRLIVRDDADSIPAWKMWLIMGAGVCGALAYTWSDTFWFSAVEGEVYAFSSFCTALVVWLMLKWENRADLPHSDRYLVLIAYVIGVSIAVHLLNLLCIPALGLIFYYRKTREATARGSLIALALSCVIVGAILYGLVPGFVKVSQWFELLCVNTLGMSYNMGVLIYAVLVVACFIWGAFELNAQRNTARIKLSFGLSILLSGMLFIGHSTWVGILLALALGIGLIVLKRVPVRIFNVILLSVLVIFTGYSSYALLLIRASANTPMNQNAPDNVFALASYLNREQYGERPLFYGPSFAEELEMQEYPAGSGNYFMPVDEYGRPATRVMDGILRDDLGNAYNTPEYSMTKVVKTSPDQPDRYVREIMRPDYRNVSDLNTLLPRIYSTQPEHVAGYKGWAGYGTPDINSIPYETRQRWAQQGYASLYEVMPYLPSLKEVTTHVDAAGNPAQQTWAWKPGFDVNLRYFVNYQLNHMYWRYFLWNFAGRQNDFQGNGEPHLGNWITGINAIDSARLGDQSALPDEFGKGNKGHNVYYMLPLLLGLIGLLYQALYKHRDNPRRGIEQFWVVFFLFFMTGVAIVLYLNQTPGQPRERDYAFAGSFYAFAIWIGMGVPAIGIMLRDLLSKKDTGNDSADSRETSAAATGAAVGIACLIGLAVPLQMVSQTWDDHDRSGRYTTRDLGRNYLSSLDPDAIIFTNGDNDTFPLWYAQEVDGFRTDVRVVNLSYLTTDWYANQLRYPSYEAPAVDMQATPSDYAYERMAYSYVVPRNRLPVEASKALDSLYSCDTKAYGVPVLFSNNIVIPVDTATAMRRYSSGYEAVDSTLLAPALADITTDLAGAGTAGLNQSKTLSLDIINRSVTGGWKRPVYFATTVPTSYYLGLSPYLASTGMAYEVTPFRKSSYSPTAQKAFANIVGDFRWGGLEGPDADKLYLDETVRRMVSSVRSAVYTTVEDLMAYPDLPAGDHARSVAVEAGYEAPETQRDMARILVETLLTKTPPSVQPFDGMLGVYIATTLTDIYEQEGGTPEELARISALLDSEGERYAQLVKYASTLDALELDRLGRSETYALQYLGAVAALRNRIDILSAIDSLPDRSKAAELLSSLKPFSLESALRVAPLVYIGGYSADDLAEYAKDDNGGEGSVVAEAIALLNLNATLGIDPMAWSREIQRRHSFGSEQWLSVLNY